MLVYLLVMFLCCILLYAMRNDKIKLRPLAIVFGIIWLMIALQEGWGGDYLAYVRHYEEIKGLRFRDLLVDDSHGEIGYKVLLWIMPTYHTWFVITIGIWCFAMAFFFYHFVPRKWWFFAILFVFFDHAILMGMIGSFSRMAIANTFLIFAVYYVLKGKRWKSVLLLLMGFFFHKSVVLMFPLIFVPIKRNKIAFPVVLVVFAVLTVFFMVSPSSWIDFVENLISRMDAFEEYTYYFENQQDIQFKGLSLVLLFYWIYLLAKQTNKKKLRGSEYLLLYYALIRIAFDLLPAVGMSTRFFYYIDAYFFAGMMCVMNRLPKNDPNKWVLAVSLLIMFWYFGFHSYAGTEFYREHWSTYNLFF